VADFAARHRDESTFIAADWGFATQIYALSNGESPILEPFRDWEEEQGGEDELLRYSTQRRGRPIYVLLQQPRLTVSPDITAQIVHSTESMAHGRRLPLEDELQRASGVRVIKFAAPDSVALEQCSAPPPPPGDLHVVSNTGRVVSVAWRGTEGARSAYTVEAGTAPRLSDVMALDLGWKMTFKAAHVKPGTYYVRVRGKNRCGGGEPSQEIRVVVE
jgi:hypothetical protein